MSLSLTFYFSVSLSLGVYLCVSFSVSDSSSHSISLCVSMSLFFYLRLCLAPIFLGLLANEGGAITIRRHWSPQTSLVFLPLVHAPWHRLIMRVFPMGFLPGRVQSVLISSFVFTVWGQG